MAEKVLAALGITPKHPATAIGPRWLPGKGQAAAVRSPIDGRELGIVQQASTGDIGPVVQAACDAFKTWRSVPAPRRGEFVRQIGQALRHRKAELAELVSWEVGKITSEALGEVQEMIDICDYAVGLSRQLYGLTIASERPGHRMMEQCHPLGPVGAITAFNFPVAVWAWNAMIGLVCGDPIIWKPSERTPLCAVAVHNIVADVMKQVPEVPVGVASLILGERDIGQALAADARVPLISATGSVRMGQQVAPIVARRLGRALLELGGNNGMILTPSADLELAIRAITFAAVGTAGQRCTSLRRLIVDNSIREKVVQRLDAVFSKLRVGNPMEEGVLVGPLIDKPAGVIMTQAIERARGAGGTVHGGGRVSENVPPGGCYVRPAIVEMPQQSAVVCEETFAPILYVLGYDTLEQAIELHNAVPQGLSSAIFTGDVREAEAFLSPAGSDCGIANVNIGTSGAEIGGAFGGEKQTGGGRESGSDSWKAYMRRVTNTVNYSKDLPLAQGVSFDI